MHRTRVTLTKSELLVVGRCPEFSPTNRVSAFGHASRDRETLKVGARPHDRREKRKLILSIQDLGLELSNDVVAKRSFSLPRDSALPGTPKGAS